MVLNQLLAGIVITLLLSIGTGIQGYRMGIEHEKANQEEKAAVVREVAQAALESAAKAIANIKVENKTIYQTLEKEIHENPVYSKCVHTDGSLRAINRALEGKPSGNSKLPKANTAK